MSAFQESTPGAKQASNLAARVPSASLVPSDAGEAHLPVATAPAALPRAATPSSLPQRQPAPPSAREVIPPALVPFERDSYAATALGDVIDRSLNAAAAHFTFGLSPPALAEAWFDWACISPLRPASGYSSFKKR